MSKHRIELILRVFINGNYTENEATQEILSVFKDSKLFNFYNFNAGFYIGGIFGIFIYYFAS